MASAFVRPPITVDYVGSYETTWASYGAIYIDNLPLGAASSDRTIILVAMPPKGSGTVGTLSATLNGSSMTKDVQTLSSIEPCVAIFRMPFATGETANLVIDTSGGTGFRAIGGSVSVYSVTGGPVSLVGSASQSTDIASPHSYTVTSETGGFALAGFNGGTDWYTDVSFTGISRDYIAQLGTSMKASASGATNAASTSVTVSFNGYSLEVSALATYARR